MATVSIEARCTQCGSTAFGSPSNNENKRTYTVERSDLKHGSGKCHGVETLRCPTCGEQTLHNRCGKSVPRGV